MVFGDDFALICPKAPQLTKTTGNKQQNSFKQLRVNFIRCKTFETEGALECLSDEEVQSFIENSRIIMFSPKNHIQMRTKG